MQRYRPIAIASRSISRLVRKIVGGAVVVLASGCTSPGPSVVVKLQVSELGTYSLDGSLVEAEALKDAVLAKHQEGKQLVVHIIPSSKARYEAVEVAVRAARDAGASIGMVGNERF